MSEEKAQVFIKNTDEFVAILQKWFESYVQNKGADTAEWLKGELSCALPEEDKEKAGKIADEIITYADSIAKAKNELEEAKERGMTPKSWLYFKLKDSAKCLSEKEFGDLVGSLGNGVLKEFQDAVNDFRYSREETAPDSPIPHIEVLPDEVPPRIGWNKTSIQDRSHDTTKLINVVTALGLAKLGLPKEQLDILIRTSDHAKDILDVITKKDTSNAVKVLAGALKEAGDKQLVDWGKVFPLLKGANGSTMMDGPGGWGGHIPWHAPELGKGSLPILSSELPAIASVAGRAVDYFNLATKIISGDINTEAAIGKAVDYTVATVGGVADVVCAQYGSAAGTTIGSSIGVLLSGIIGPEAIPFCAAAGSAIGGFLGEKVAKPLKQGLAYLGAKAEVVCKTVVDGVRSVGGKVIHGIKSAVCAVGDAVSNAASRAWEGVKSIGRSIASFFGF